MLGAIIGDISGSRFEWNNIKTKTFDLFTEDCFPTDDSIMTLAIAKTLKEMGTMSDNDIAKVTELPLHEVVTLGISMTVKVVKN